MIDWLNTQEVKADKESARGGMKHFVLTTLMGELASSSGVIAHSGSGMSQVPSGMNIPASGNEIEPAIWKLPIGGRPVGGERMKKQW